VENVGGDEVDKVFDGELLLLLRQSDDTLRVKHVGGGLKIDGLQRPHFQGEHVALHVGVWLQLLRDAVRLEQNNVVLEHGKLLQWLHLR
jgi:hypothetical protein